MKQKTEEKKKKLKKYWLFEKIKRIDKPLAKIKKGKK